uniref:Putative secreted salivary gland peptide ixodes scapularis secreted salivary gland peptide n=1 Tax=Amblyomma cajennense TaxID=34607 RepID=A0A023FG11_AMBCJ
MKPLQIVLCFGLLAAACAATLETAAAELKHHKTQQDRDLQTSLALVFQAVDNWLEANEGLEPVEAEQRLKDLLTEVAEQHKLLSAIEEDDDDDEDEVRAYGLGKKLKKWRKKAKKILSDAAKAVVVNKVVGAAAGALG